LNLKQTMMIYLNYNNLDEATQTRLLQDSKSEVEQKFGNDLKSYAKQQHLDYNTILEEEAIKNLYSYQYVFNI
tara:strand:- start:436 stop:654 length:219 start_codon:yes stop_codon:yes gene_type:complete